LPAKITAETAPRTATRAIVVPWWPPLPHLAAQKHHRTAHKAATRVVARFTAAATHV